MLAWPALPAPQKIPASYRGKTMLNMPVGFTEKVIALTFDDGPNPATTPSILSALRRYRAKATFYVVGGMVHNREWILRRAAAEGHQIGNHTFSHHARPPMSRAITEIAHTDARIKGAVGYLPTTFRPPFGILNSATTAVERSKGSPIVLWTGDSLDWKYKNADMVYRRVMANAHPGGVILMHDIHPSTMQAVPRILASLSLRGYRCITIPEMMVKWDEFSAKRAATLKAKAAKATMVATNVRPK